MAKTVAIGFAIILVIIGLAIIALDGSIDSSQQGMAQSWMFKGAFATYEGQVDSYNIGAKIQIIDVNATHVRIETDSTISTPFAPALSDQTTSWINKTDITFQPKGETLMRTYNTQIQVRAVDLRNCTAYDYVNEAINATYYIDSAILFPVRISYTTSFENQTYILEFNLNDTNISGLM